MIQMPRIEDQGDVRGKRVIARVEFLAIADRVGHVSTGGGASLDLLGGANLPGVLALTGERNA